MMNLAVVAIIVHDDCCLFLRRNNPPKNWCPPCGRLKRDEDPLSGLKREVLEESGLQISPLMPVSVWSGLHNRKKVISITYVCIADSFQVTLSNEHSDFVWVPIEDLSKEKIDTDFKIKEWLLFIKVANIFNTEKNRRPF
jgi:8-oxo-dGTP diphosphatase